MKLINFEGMSFFGPGSEWFWGMAQFVVVAITLLAIYRQVRLQRSASAILLMDALNKQWDDDRMLRLRLEAATQLRRGDGFDAIYPVLTPLCTFFEDMASLQEAGHVESRFVWESWGRTIQFWWTILRPSIEQGRIAEDQPEGNRGFENLSALMRKMDADNGIRPFTPDPEFITRRLDAMIAQATFLLRIERDPPSETAPKAPKPPASSRNKLSVPTP